MAALNRVALFRTIYKGPCGRRWGINQGNRTFSVCSYLSEANPAQSPVETQETLGSDAKDEIAHNDSNEQTPKSRAQVPKWDRKIRPLPDSSTIRATKPDEPGFLVFLTRNGGKKYRHAYHVTLGRMVVYIPQSVAIAWNLDEAFLVDRAARIRLDLTDGVHPHRWALDCDPGDEGARLGVMLSYNSFEPVWMESMARSAMATANAMVDIMTGKVTDDEHHDWGHDRYPILGPLSNLIAHNSWNDKVEVNIDGQKPKYIYRWKLNRTGEEALEQMEKNLSCDEVSRERFARLLKDWDELGYLRGRFKKAYNFKHNKMLKLLE